MRQLWDYGHRHILFVGLDTGIYNENVADRERGYLKALQDFDAESNAGNYIVRTDYESSSLPGKIEAAFHSLKKRPTAVFCSMDVLVPGAVAGIESAGLSIPEDVSIVGFDGFLKDSYFPMDIATNIQPLKEMGAGAAEILLRHIDDPLTKKEKLVFDVSFVFGGSLRKL